MARKHDLPREFIEWQIELRRHTAEERRGAPHVGVAPLVTVKQPSFPLGVVSHSVICGLLPHPDQLEKKTIEFRELYENGIAEGARVVYDRGLAYLRNYYQSVDDFDPASITTLLAKDLPLVTALRANARCALLFYVFDLVDRSEIGRLRCLQLEAEADVLESGPVHDNVWWHNTLFHGPAEDSVVIHFRCSEAHDTRFGMLEKTD